MARLRDVPVVLRKVGPLTFLRRVHAEITADNVFTLASALAYSWLFAVFPFMIFLLSLVPYLPERYKAGAEERIAEAVSALPAQAATLVQENVRTVLHDRKEGLLGIGILLTVWAASGGMAATMSAIDAAYDVRKPRPFYRQRPLAVGLTVVAATLIVSVLVLIPVGTLVIKLFATYGEQWLAAIGLSPKLLLPIIAVGQVLRYVLAVLLLFGLLSVVYHFAPNIRQTYRLVTPGAVFVVAVWLALGIGFRWYINAYGQASYAKTYGTVGGVAILLLMFYLDALVLLIGAEINSEIDLETRGVKGELEQQAGPSSHGPAAAVAAGQGTKMEDGG